jgi:hypothetical protein
MNIYVYLVTSTLYINFRNQSLLLKIDLVLTT